MKLFQLMTPESGFGYHFARTLIIFHMTIDNCPSDSYSEHNSMLRRMIERYLVLKTRRFLIFDGISKPFHLAIKNPLALEAHNGYEDQALSNLPADSKASQD